MNKKTSRGAIVLAIVLLLAIIGVSTILVGRALGWWQYADLPLIGKWFPATPSPPANGDEEEPDPETQIELLQMEIEQRERRISDLQDLVRDKDKQLQQQAQELLTLEQKLAGKQTAEIDKNIKAAARIYENMRAEQAAAVMEHLSDAEASQILQAMSAEAAGAILGKMQPARAAKLASIKK